MSAKIITPNDLPKNTENIYTYVQAKVPVREISVTKVSPIGTPLMRSEKSLSLQSLHKLVTDTSLALTGKIPTLGHLRSFLSPEGRKTDAYQKVKRGYDNLFSNVVFPYYPASYKDAKHLKTEVIFFDFDLDRLDLEEIELMKRRLSNDKAIPFCAASPRGVWGVILVNNYTQGNVDALCTYFLDYYQLKLDKGAIKPKQLRFAYHDPTAYYSDSAMALRLPIVPKVNKPSKVVSNGLSVSNLDSIDIAAKHYAKILESKFGAFGDGNRNNLAYYAGLKMKNWGFGIDESLSAFDAVWGLQSFREHVVSFRSGWEQARFQEPFKASQYRPKTRERLKASGASIPSQESNTVLKKRPKARFLPLEVSERNLFGSFERYIGNYDRLPELMDSLFASKRTILSVPPRSGKSTLVAGGEHVAKGFLEYAESKYTDCTFMYIAPRKALALSEAQNHKERSFVAFCDGGLSSGQYKVNDHTRICTTTATATKLLKKAIDHERNVVVLFDEVHALFTDTYQNHGKLLHLLGSDRVHHIIGLTGTVLEKPFEGFGWKVYALDRKINPETTINYRYTSNEKETNRNLLTIAKNLLDKRVLYFTKSVKDTAKIERLVARTGARVFRHNGKISKAYADANSALQSIIIKGLMPEKTHLVANRTLEVGVNVKNCDVVVYIMQQTSSFTYDLLDFYQSINRNRNEKIHVELIIQQPSKETLAKKVEQRPNSLKDFDFERIKGSDSLARDKYLAVKINKALVALEELPEFDSEVEKLKEKASNIGLVSVPNSLNLSKKGDVYTVYHEGYINSQYEEICRAVLPSEIPEMIESLMPYARVIHCGKALITNELDSQENEVIAQLEADKDVFLDTFNEALKVHLWHLVVLFFEYTDDSELREKFLQTPKFQHVGDDASVNSILADSDHSFSEVSAFWGDMISEFYEIVTPYMLRICEMSSILGERVDDSELIDLAFLPNAAYGKMKAQFQTAKYRELKANHTDLEQVAILGKANYAKQREAWKEAVQVIDIAKKEAAKGHTPRTIKDAVNAKCKRKFKNARALVSFLNNFVSTWKPTKYTLAIGDFWDFEEVLPLAMDKIAKINSEKPEKPETESYLSILEAHSKRSDESEVFPLPEPEKSLESNGNTFNLAAASVMPDPIKEFLDVF